MPPLITVGMLRARLRDLPDAMPVVVSHPALGDDLDDVTDARVIHDAGQTEGDVLVIQSEPA